MHDEEIRLPLSRLNNRGDKSIHAGAHQHPLEQREDTEFDARSGRAPEGIHRPDQIKQMLDISIRAAKLRKEPLDHVLFYGPRFGQDHLASIIARELDVEITVSSGP